jgi:hypothetical protein
LGKGSDGKLTKFVFSPRNNPSQNSWNGVKIVELKSEIFGSQGYIPIDFT